MTHFYRNHHDKIIKLLGQFPCVAIIGARQVGKSTLAKSCCPDWHYIDLERPDTLERIQADPVFFFEQYPRHIIIDEAQTYPDLFNVLRGVIDSDREQNGRFILTGSSSTELLSHLSDSLAGRLAIIELGTLKANEYHQTQLSPLYQIFENKLNANKLPQGEPPITNEIMRHCWLKGGYPQPLQHNATAEFYLQWMEQYRNTYVNRDIAALFPRLNKQAYQRFLSILSKLSSTILNRSDIARTINVNEKTIREYLQIIEGTFIWRQLPSLEKNIIKSVIKMPKGHMRDSGLLHYLLRIQTLEDLYESPHAGHSFESFVIEETLKGIESTMVTNWTAHYYRTRKGQEVDLILEGNFGRLPIEIKHHAHTPIKQLKSLTQFIEEQQCPFGLIINQATHAEWLTKHIYQLPVGWL